MKTALEWLIEQWPILVSQIPERILEQAKEMEKEQIVEAHGIKLKKSKDEGNYEFCFSGEDYYNKTYKNESK
jgi:hypothetical protein